jgi:mRNA interferase YafQ
MLTTIKRTTRFKRDFKRELKGQHRKTLDQDLLEVVKMLLAETPMPEKFHDHPLTGEWVDHRDLHLKPDLVLIYQKQGDDTLVLVRIGSHSELSL